MNVRWRLVALAVVLLLPGLVFARWLDSNGLSGDLSTPQLPGRVGPWVTTNEERLDDAVLAAIGPDAYALRLYEAPGRTPIWIYVGLYAGRVGHGKGAHDPETCYPAQGFEILDSESIEIELTAGEELRVKRLAAHRGLHHEAVVYWFQPAARWPAAGVNEQLLRVVDAVTGRPQYAFVRLSGPAEAGRSAARDLAEFARAIAPTIRDALDSPENRATAEVAASRS